MWTQPKKTIRRVIDSNPDSKLWLLSIIYGLPMMFYYAQQASLGQNNNIPLILVVCAMGAIIFGYIGINIGAFFLHFTGKWIGSKSTFKEVRAAVAYSNVTNLVSIIIWFLLMAMVGNQVFMIDFPYAASVGAMGGLMSLIFIVQFVVAIWSLVIFVGALAEAQKFSNFKAVINVLLPIGLMVAFLWTLGLVLTLLGSPGTQG
jgi:hypothetical protein